MAKLFFVLLTFATSLAHANILTCNDERDNTLGVVMNLQKGQIDIYENRQLVGTERGQFTNCGSAGVDRGATDQRVECDFVSGGKNLGSVTLRTRGFLGFYNMQLADRNFRGRCQ